MRKFALMFLAVMFSLSLSVVDPWRASPVLAGDSIGVEIDGKQVNFTPYGAEPEVVNGRTMVPIRAVVETLGSTITMGSDSFTVSRGSKTIRIIWNSDTAYVDGQPVKLDAPAYVKNDRTYVPLRFISETFNSAVAYDPDKNTAVIDTFDPSRMTQTTVTRVVDGDTFHATIDGRDETVRLIGVDTPETVKPNTPVMPYGPEASAFTHQMLEGKQVYLAFDIQQRDKYGRVLAYAYLPSGTFFNAELVKQGYARVETVPPNVRHVDLFVALSKEARAAHRGFWSLPEDPWSGGGSSDLGGNNNGGQQGGGNQPQPPSSGQTGNAIIDSVDLSGEVVTIKNVDSKDIDMTGWRLVSEEGNQTFNFPSGFVLKAGSSVKIVSGPKAADGPPSQLLWTKSYVWNNNGDTAILYDGQGREVSRK